MIITKACSIQVKASDGDQGIVEAIAATYDKDSVGDKIVPGAFEKTLKEWDASGRKIPFIFAHKHDDPNAYIGTVLEAKETDAGLWVKAQLDMDDPAAAKVFRLMKDGRVNQLSFAYKVEEGAFVQKKDDDGGDAYYELRELKLYEAGPCLVGANQNTTVLGAKSNRDAVAGRDAELTVVGKTYADIALSALRLAKISELDTSTLKNIHGIIEGLGVVCQVPTKATTSEAVDKADEPDTEKANDPASHEVMLSYELDELISSIDD